MSGPLAALLLLSGGWLPVGGPVAASVSASVAASVSASVSVPIPAPVSPPNPDDAFDTARSQRRAGDSGAAAQTLQAQLQSHRTDGDYVGLLGLCLMDTGAVAQARNLQSELGAGASASFRLEILRGRLAQADNDLEAAEDAYREATRLNEKAVEAWVLRVRAQMAAQRFGKALKLAERLEAVNAEVGRPLSSEILRLQGDGYRRLGASTIELAADKYLEALGKTPEDDALAERVLETQLNAVRLGAVAELVAERFADEAHALQRHYWTGRQRAALQDAEGARAAFEAALGIDGQHADSALWLAKLALDDGQLDAAREWLARCSSAGLATAQTELLMGEVLTGLGEWTAAEVHLRAAADLDPDLTKALYLLGRLLLRTGQTEEARAVLAHFAELTSPPAVDDADR